MSNPFESPGYDDAPVPPVERRSVRLKRVGVLSVAIFFGIAGVLMGLIGGVIFFLAGLAGVAAGPNNAGAAFGVGLSMLFVLPLMYGVSFFLAGLINAAVYNVVAGISGGIELEFGTD